MRTPFAAALLVLFAGCAVDTGSSTQYAQATATADAPDRSPETYALGSTLDVSGAVPRDAEAEAFGRGMDVFLSIDMASASTDQTIEVQWLDGAGRVIRRQTRHVPVGTPYAAFASGNNVTAIPGQRRALVVIDGRRVAEKAFRVL